MSCKLAGQLGLEPKFTVHYSHRSPPHRTSREDYTRPNLHGQTEWYTYRRTEPGTLLHGRLLQCTGTLCKQKETSRNCPTRSFRQLFHMLVVKSSSLPSICAQTHIFSSTPPLRCWQTWPVCHMLDDSEGRSWNSVDGNIRRTHLSRSDGFDFIWTIAATCARPCASVTCSGSSLIHWSDPLGEAAVFTHTWCAFIKPCHTSHVLPHVTYLPEFPYLHSDSHEKDIDLDSAYRCPSLQPMGNDIPGGALQRFGKKIAEAISLTVGSFF